MQRALCRLRCAAQGGDNWLAKRAPRRTLDPHFGFRFFRSQCSTRKTRPMCSSYSRLRRSVVTRSIRTVSTGMGGVIPFRRTSPEGRLNALETCRPVGFDLPIFDALCTGHDLREPFALKCCGNDVQTSSLPHFLFSCSDPNRFA
jgi:hypothetical protein